MPWVSLEDDFHSNPKIVEAGLDGSGLYARALSHCGAYLTDGYIGGGSLLQLAERRKKVIDKCVQVGLFVIDGKGYRIKDYLDYNPSRADVEERRAALQEAGKKGARKRWQKRDTGDSPPDSPGHSPPHDLANGETMARAGAVSPAPSPAKELPGAKAPSGDFEDDPLDEQSIVRVYDTWRTVFDKKRSNYATISPKRRAIIKRRLKKHSATDLCRALEAVKLETPRWWITHDDLTTLLDTDERVDHFLDLIGKPPAELDSPNGTGRRVGMSPADIVAYTKGRP